MTTTPPTFRPLVEPPTPLHGARFEDYDSPTKRRNLRGSRRAQHRTPSPPAANKTSTPDSSSPRRRSARIGSSNHTYSPTSPGLDTIQTMTQTSQHTSLKPETSSAAMLPTPVKTPRKKEVKSLPPASRVLFSNRPTTIEEAMPKKHKRTRRNIGYSLDSFEGDDAAGPEIEIYTDSKEKVPEVDESADNPFYDTVSKNRTGKKKTKVHDHNKQVQEVLEKDEGMVYVFRGKKIFRKFEPEDGHLPPHGLESAADDLGLNDLESPRHFTRSSVKPRLLFPQATQQHSTLSDEEAPTDIEEGNDEPEIETPIKRDYMPTTPPDTSRAKRTADKAGLDDTDARDSEGSGAVTLKKAKVPSPFLNWHRTKGAHGSAKGRKRTAEDLERGEATQEAKG